MSSRNTIIIHFAPLELYPPIQNLLHDLNRNVTNYKFIVITTKPINTALSNFKLTSSCIRVVRIGRSSAALPSVSRYFNYILFYLASLMILLVKRPMRVLYFETISSWPAYIYKRYVNRACELLIHYHEYTSPEEYQSGMALNKYFLGLEKFIYANAIWVSHTNHFRMNMFKADISPILLKSPQVMPNYPPISWNLSPRDFNVAPIRIVYVGSLSLFTMYTTVFSEWVISRQGKVIWDIYVPNKTADVIDFFEKLDSPYINLKPAVPYSALPTVLSRYQVGVVLYKGHIPNYVYSAPNKVFEYLACGLDVWFPNVLIGSMEFATVANVPKIIPIDFDHLNLFDFDGSIARDGNIKANVFNCENSTEQLVKLLTS